MTKEQSIAILNNNLSQGELGEAFDVYIKREIANTAILLRCAQGDTVKYLQGKLDGLDFLYQSTILSLSENDRVKVKSRIEYFFDIFTKKHRVDK